MVNKISTQFQKHNDQNDKWFQKVDWEFFSQNISKQYQKKWVTKWWSIYRSVTLRDSHVIKQYINWQKMVKTQKTNDRPKTSTKPPKIKEKWGQSDKNSKTTHNRVGY